MAALSDVINVAEAPKTQKLSPEEQKEAWKKLISEECDRKGKEIASKKKEVNQEPDGRLLGSELEVFVRIRPLLGHELKRDELRIVFAPGPTNFLATETRLDVRGVPRIKPHSFTVDGALGPDVKTADVLQRLISEPLRLAKDGGIATVLAYGQTGTGKTFTVEGLLRGMADELYKDLESRSLELHMTCFELLGNASRDLLSENQDGVVDIMEDKFGKIVPRNAVEVQVRNGDHFLELVTSCLASRRTRSTFKNDASSRSHAIFGLRFDNTRVKEAEDGKLYVVDLAGSENTADTRFHDKAAVAETKQINASLMALKECVRSRTLSVLQPDKTFHVPYRQSKLTLLLKDAFELESHRLCKTVVIACVSPAQTDTAMSLNTLRYAAPFKIGQANREKVKPDPDNPATWTNEQLRQWVKAESKGVIDPETLCPWESGMQLLRLPEAEFLLRVTENNPSYGEKRAKGFYTALWKLLVDARNKERNRKARQAKREMKRKDKKWVEDHLKELSMRSSADMEPVEDEELRKHLTLGIRSNPSKGRVAKNWE